MENNNTSKVNSGVYILLSILFVVNPFLSLVISLVYLVHRKCASKYDFVCFFLLQAAWISLINMGKVPSGDHGVYIRMFFAVPDKTFYETVFMAWGGSGREPVYSFIVWLGYYVFAGSSKLFFFFLSFVIYMLHYLSVYKVFKSVNASKAAIISGVLVLTFFTQYFVMTLQLVRQMLAAAIIIYAISKKAVSGKNSWGWLISGCLIHTSAMLLAALSFIPMFSEKIRRNKAFLVVASLGIFLLFGNVLAGSLVGTINIDTINYALHRMSTEQSDASGGMSLGILMIVSIPLMAVIVNLLITNNYSYETDLGIRKSSLYPLIYICAFTIIYVLSLSHSPLLQYRLFYFLYSFIPLLLPLVFKAGSKFELPYCTTISLFFVVRFFLQYSSMAWNYPSLFDVVLQPLPYYIFTEFYHFDFMP